jgi:hypothetical protein
MRGSQGECTYFSRRGRHVNDDFAMLVNSLHKFLEEQHRKSQLRKAKAQYFYL